MVGREWIYQSVRAGFDFATPYHSWERGLNEHTHGLVRQDFPKGTDFRQVTPAQVRAVEERINQRSRKVLGYWPLAAVFAEALALPQKVVIPRPSPPFPEARIRRAGPRSAEVSLKRPERALAS